MLLPDWWFPATNDPHQADSQETTLVLREAMHSLRNSATDLSYSTQTGAILHHRPTPQTNSYPSAATKNIYMRCYLAADTLT